ncbi:MAG: hypothetical protein FWF79_04380 [Defluviitaleaceae bacterium]|nr:hypothetical protein [Defluviitaleaceae bacterium]
MTATRERVLQQLEYVPEDKLQSLFDYMRFVCEPSPPYEITTKEEFYRNIEEGLEDVRQGKVQPAEEAFEDIWQELAKHE